MNILYADGRFDNNKPRLLLIGSTGKIGQRVLEELTKSNKFQISLLLRATGSYNNIFNNRLIKGDILDRSLQEGIRWADFIINCSGFVSYKRPDKAKLYSINVQGVKNMLDYCIKLNKPLIHTSSAIAYGSSTTPINFKECDNYSDVYRGTYAQTKALADELIINSGVRYLLLRPSTLISTLTSLYNFYKMGFVAELSGGASFALMDDIAPAYLSAIELFAQGAPSSIYNLGGHNLTFKEVFSQFQALDARSTKTVSIRTLKNISWINDFILLPAFNKSLITVDNYRTGCHYTFINSDKAQDELNYKISPFEVSLRRNLLCL